MSAIGITDSVGVGSVLERTSGWALDEVGYEYWIGDAGAGVGIGKGMDHTNGDCKGTAMSPENRTGV